MAPLDSQWRCIRILELLLLFDSSSYLRTLTMSDVSMVTGYWLLQDYTRLLGSFHSIEYWLPVLTDLP